MGAVMLLPGGGARYTSEAFAAAGVGADEIDCSFCSELAVQQVIVGSPAGSYQLEERLTGSGGWAQLGSQIPVSVDGTITKFNLSQRPFGHIRINGSSITGLSANVTAQFILQGGRVAGGSIF